jgi:surfeit locus 1 family protein
MLEPERSERSRWWPALAVVLGVAAAVALGQWQLGRGAQKRQLQAQYEAQSAQPAIHVGAERLRAADVDLRPVEARGIFEPRYAVFIDNRIHHGVPGYYVMMPLHIEHSALYVLVNRGWIARPAYRTELPAVRTPTDAVTIRGVAMVPSGRAFELSSDVYEGSIWQNLTIERYRKRIGIDIQPFVLRQGNALDDGLVRAWDPPDFGIEKHYAYAFQWFALGVTLLIFYAVTQLRRNRTST